MLPLSPFQYLTPELVQGIFSKIDRGDFSTINAIQLVCKQFQEHASYTFYEKWVYELRLIYFNTLNDTEIFFDHLLEGKTEEEVVITEEKLLDAIALIKKSAMDVNDSCYDGTPLHINVLYLNSLPIARLLLAKGAEVDHTDHMGFSPLHIAASKCSLAFCRFFIEHGADRNLIGTELRYTPLHLAALGYRRTGISDAYDYLASLPGIDHEILDLENRKARDLLPLPPSTDG